MADTYDNLQQCAATRVNILKCREKHLCENVAFCSYSASSSKVSYCLHTAEDAGSIPASPTLKNLVLQVKREQDRKTGRNSALFNSYPSIPGRLPSPLGR